MLVQGLPHKVLSDLIQFQARTASRRLPASPRLQALSSLACRRSSSRRPLAAGPDSSWSDGRPSGRALCGATRSSVTHGPGGVCPCRRQCAVCTHSLWRGARGPAGTGGDRCTGPARAAAISWRASISGGAPPVVPHGPGPGGGEQAPRPRPGEVVAHQLLQGPAAPGILGGAAGTSIVVRAVLHARRCGRRPFLAGNAPAQLPAQVQLVKHGADLHAPLTARCNVPVAPHEWTPSHDAHCLLALSPAADSLFMCSGGASLRVFALDPPLAGARWVGTGCWGSLAVSWHHAAAATKLCWLDL